MAGPLPYPFHVMVKPHGPVCNLACRYCFYLHKSTLLESSSRWRMSDAVLESFTRQYLAAHPDGFPVNFAWQGGEPTLMGVDFFRRAVALQKQHRRDGQSVTNSFQTNGILIDDDWAAFFKEHDFLVGVSVDGPRGIHNQHRVDTGGAGSFDRVMAGVGVLKRHGVHYNALTCVSNISPPQALVIYRFLREHFEHIQFIPVVEETGFAAAAPFLPDAAGTAGRKPGALVQGWSVTPEGYGEFLCTVFDEWMCHNVGRVFVQLFDMTLARWVGRLAALCVFAPICGKALVLEHDGTVYACDHFVYPEYRVGALSETPLAELVNGARQRRFGEDKRDRLPAKCRACAYLPLCGGGCPKERFITAPDGGRELNYLCAAFERFFKHTEHHLRAMAELVMHGRPAALHMDRLRAVPAPPPRPNAPCPCGSGKRFKACCGAAGRRTQ
ncbi:MAG: anaerobic sulfatase maturase [Planctomycetota bacterium]